MSLLQLLRCRPALDCVTQFHSNDPLCIYRLVRDESPKTLLEVRVTWLLSSIPPGKKSVSTPRRLSGESLRSSSLHCCDRCLVVLSDPLVQVFSIGAVSFVQFLISPLVPFRSSCAPSQFPSMPAITSFSIVCSFISVPISLMVQPASGGLWSSAFPIWSCHIFWSVLQFFRSVDWHALLSSIHL